MAFFCLILVVAEAKHYLIETVEKRQQPDEKYRPPHREDDFLKII